MADPTPLRPATAVRSDRKAEFVRQLSQSFDLFIERTGEEPEAVVFVLTGIKQGTQCGYLVLGESQGNATGVLAKAMAIVTHEAIHGD